MKSLGRLLKASALVLSLALSGCGDNGGGSPAMTTSLAGKVTFPAVSAAPAKASQASKAAAADLTLEIRDLNGTLVGAPLPLTPVSGAADTYTYPAAIVGYGNDYVLTAVRGSQVLRALLDKGALAGVSVPKDLNAISTTAVILAEQKLALPIGTLGAGALPAGTDPAALSASLAGALKPAGLESDLSDALSASTPGAVGVSAVQAQLASLANAVTAVLKKNIDPAGYLSGQTATSITYTAYSISGGVVQQTATTVTAYTDVATLLAQTAQDYNPGPPPAPGAGYTVGGKVMTPSGSGIEGVTVTIGGTTTTVTTAADGSYSFTGVQNGTYALSASKSGQTFGPAPLTVVVNNGNVAGQDFITVVEATAVLTGDKFFTFADGVISGGAPSEIMYDDVEEGLFLPHSTALRTTQAYADIVRAPYGIYRDSNEPSRPIFPVTPGTVYVFRSGMLGMTETLSYYKLEIISATKRPTVESTDFGAVTFRYTQILPPDGLDVFGEWDYGNGRRLSVLSDLSMDYTSMEGAPVILLHPLSYTGRTTLGGRFISWTGSGELETGTVTVTVSLTTDGKLNATLVGEAPLGTVTLTGGTKQP